MEDERELPLKRVELSLTKFNEVAIPHHLDLLRQHRANINKYETSGEYARVRAEQAHAKRVASRLRALLAEMDALRRRVRVSDRAAFDARTQRARDLTLRAVMDYLGVIERSCMALAGGPRGGRARCRGRGEESSEAAVSATAAGSATSSDSVGVVRAGGELMQLQIDEQEVELREREAALRGWRELQGELRALHDAWQHLQAAALAQRDQVNSTAESVALADGNVQAARADLALSERMKAGALGAGGALVGALTGGPVGLLLGAKAGAAAVLAGSALGYLGGKFIGRRRQLQLDKDTSEEVVESRKDR